MSDDSVLSTPGQPQHASSLAANNRGTDRITISGPWITEKEISYVTDAVATAWYGNANVYHERFQRAFCEYLGVRHAVPLPSGTSAIHLALLALGVGPGDEVIVPDLTWIGSAAPITYCGAQPVFADVDPTTWCVAADSFAACITPRTKAVIPVDLYGSLPEVDDIRAVAISHGVAVIEDAAEAIGSEHRGRRAGTFGDMGVFSFHGSKTMTTGEGGMLVTDRTDLHERVLVLADHGRRPSERGMFWNHEVAWKYKMSSMQAALGLAQLERIDELVTRKRQIFAWYHSELAGAEGLTLNCEPPGTTNSYWMVTAILDPKLGIQKDRLIRLMADHKIDVRPVFHPLSSLPAYEGWPEAAAARHRNTVSYRLSPYGVNLPSGMSMTEEKVRFVCRALRKVLSQSA
ncbi:MAG: DegT/DnrJ/EryC1/StrS family aminotransferase [bacterium]